MLNHLLVFAAVFGLDCAFALYIIATAQKRAGAAAFWSAIIMGLNGYLAITWVGDPTTVAAAVLGAVAGTYASIRWFSR